MNAATLCVINWFNKNPQERAKIEAKIDEDKQDISSWRKYHSFLSDIIRDRLYNSLTDYITDYLPDGAEFSAKDELLCFALYSWRERVHWGEVAEFFRAYFEGQE